MLRDPVWQLLDSPVIVGDCIEVMSSLPAGSVDAICTDPPYGLEFMGKDWDSFKPATARGAGGQFANGTIGGYDGKPMPRHGKRWKLKRCANCGHVQGGGSPCVCPVPAWMTETEPGAPSFATAFQAWCEQWAREALRVLRPGGHLLAFGGTRTYHRLAAGIEDAGFEIRDTLAWMYGSGFPKSLDVSKAIDKRRDWTALRHIQGAIKAARTASGKTLRQLGDECGEAWWYRGGYLFFETGMSIPTREQWGKLKAALAPHLGDDLDGAFDEAEREVIRERTMIQGGGTSLELRMGERREVEANITAPATPEAQAWEGWGTALKPGYEPVVLARKPLSGTVAATVLEYGTGALNIDATRIGYASEADLAQTRSQNPGRDDLVTSDVYGAGRGQRSVNDAGRWPANVMLDREAAAALDAQTGESTASDHVRHNSAGAMGYGGSIRAFENTGYSDSGGASRFFATFDASPDPWTAPVDTGAERFLYSAKASGAERSAGLDGFERRENVALHGNTLSDPRMDRPQERRAQANIHPTVKPIDVMRWLIRLVTPPGGLVLDMFAGSGTTGCAAALEGVAFVGIEREPEYAAIARARIAWWREHPEGVELVDRLAAESTRAAVADGGQVSIFDVLDDAA